jgi:hypothetical protein
MYQPIDVNGAKPFKHDTHTSAWAHWTAIVLRSLPDEIRTQPIAPGYVDYGGLADMLDYYVDFDALEVARQTTGLMTVAGYAHHIASDSYGGGCIYLPYFCERTLLPPPPAFNGIIEVLMESGVIRSYLSTIPHAGVSGLTERMPWEVREQVRHWRKYKRLKWEADGKLTPIKGHFAHVSQNDPTKVAFTENAAKGERDIQLAMRPGRYLKRFYPHLTDEAIADIVGDMGRDYSEYDLRFAKTADEIEEVYTNGPNSCMSKPASSYDSHCHPVRVYGYSDLQVAHLILKKTSAITARALVWPEQRKIGRIYGDEMRLEKMLRDLGYDARKCLNGRDLIGAKFRLIYNKNGNGTVMPYIDGTNCYTQIDKSWCRISERGGSACYTHGLDGEYGEHDHTCERCEDGCSGDDAYVVYTSRRSTQTWCHDCWEYHAVFCDRGTEYVLEEDINEVLIELSNGERSTQMWSTWACEGNAYHCDNLETYVSDDVQSYAMENGETWCKWAFEDDGVEVDGAFYPKYEAPIEPDTPTTESEAWHTQHGPHVRLRPWVFAGGDTTKTWLEYWAMIDGDRKKKLAAALAAPLPEFTIENA